MRRLPMMTANPSICISSLRMRWWTTVALCMIVILTAPAFGEVEAITSPSNESTPGTAPRAHDPGHRRMLDLLDQIAQRTPDENPYLGSRQVREMNQKLSSLGENPSVRTKWNLHFQAGTAELRLGKIQSGIDHLTQAYRLLPKPEMDDFKTSFQLGIAYLRLGETQNCCLRHTAESCIVPIQKGALHTQPDGSTKAIQYFLEVLENKPQNSESHMAARWLLNIAYMTLGGYPDDVPKAYLIPTTAFTSEIDFPRFTNVAPKLGLDTFNMCGGVVVDDFDGDDYLDIFTTTWDAVGDARFFRNHRDGTFVDQTSHAGLEGVYGGLNVVPADYDNDGDLDVLVLRGAWLNVAGRHPNSLLRNHGDGTFTDVTFEAGLGDVHYPTQTAAWADYDNDGDLDLYIGNEDTPEVTAPGQLFRNNGNGTFTDVSAEAGVQEQLYAKGATWGDFDGDRFPDLYVSNMGRPNRLYRNNHDGTFTNVAPELDVTGPNGSFPVWFWDFDNDGILDLFVGSYTGRIGFLAPHYLGIPVSYELACLYRGDGHGSFNEVAREQGLRYPILAMGANFGDLNNDGYLDFYLGTGDPEYVSLMPNLMFLNRMGKGFTNVTMAGGFGHLQKGHAIAFADLDNDGDLDVFEQMGGAFPGDEYGNALFENPGSDHHWITIKLVGVESNRSAIGARIHIDVEEQGQMRSIYRYVSSGGSFGANPLRQTIGLGTAARIHTLEIFWPTSGRTQRFSRVDAGQTIQIDEDQDAYTQLDLKRLRF